MHLLLSRIVEAAEDQCPAPDGGPRPAPGETVVIGTRLIREPVTAETYGVATGLSRSPMPRNKGCERTLARVLMFCVSEGAGPKSPQAGGHTQCAGGGIGRRAGFRFQCPQGRGGSTPPSRTSWKPLRSRTWGAFACSGATSGREVSHGVWDAAYGVRGARASEAASEVGAGSWEWGGARGGVGRDGWRWGRGWEWGGREVAWVGDGWRWERGWEWGGREVAWVGDGWRWGGRGRVVDGWEVVRKVGCAQAGSCPQGLTPLGHRAVRSARVDVRLVEPSDVRTMRDVRGRRSW